MTNDAKDVALAEVKVQGYRSCVDTTLAPDPSLTALIGINGAGKTNLLSAINLLSQQTLNLLLNPSTPSQNEAAITAWFLVDGKRIGYRLRLHLSVSGKNSDEISGISEEWNFGAITRSRAWKSLPPGVFPISTRIRPGTRSITQTINLKRRDLDRYLYLQWKSNSELSQRDFFPDETIENPEVALCAQRVMNFCQGITYYSASQFTDPSRCPTSFEIDSEGRLADGYSGVKVHTKFLHDLYTLKKKNPDLYKIYEEFISKRELGLVSRLTWKEIRLSSSVADVKSGGKVTKVRKYKTLVIPKIQIGSSHITFNQLSEGTFKTLAMIFYIMTDASSCLLIEEPEVCVHHGLLSRIISTIKAYAQTKQIIFSTHSDLVLDQLEPSNVVVVAMTRSGTTATPMETWVGSDGRAALHTYLEESGTLGEYWRSGGLS